MQNNFRIRLYKYDYLEEHPELTTKKERKQIPWEDLIYEDRANLGPRGLKALLFPWKEDNRAEAYMPPKNTSSPSEEAEDELIMDDEAAAENETLNDDERLDNHQFNNEETDNTGNSTTEVTNEAETAGLTEKKYE